MNLSSWVSLQTSVVLPMSQCALLTSVAPMMTAASLARVTIDPDRLLAHDQSLAADEMR